MNKSEQLETTGRSDSWTVLVVFSDPLTSSRFCWGPQTRNTQLHPGFQPEKDNMIQGRHYPESIWSSVKSFVCQSSWQTRQTVQMNDSHWYLHILKYVITVFIRCLNLNPCWSAVISCLHVRASVCSHNPSVKKGRCFFTQNAKEASVDRDHTAAPSRWQNIQLLCFRKRIWQIVCTELKRRQKVNIRRTDKVKQPIWDPISFC